MSTSTMFAIEDIAASLCDKENVVVAVLDFTIGQVADSADDAGEKAALIDVWMTDPDLYRENRASYFDANPDGPAAEDTRTEGEKLIDQHMGATKATKLDRSIREIERLARDLFLNTKYTLKYLLLGEECHYFVEEAMSVGAKRADAVFRIEERLNERGIGIKDIRVNDWMAVYGLACLCNDKKTVDAIDADWIKSVAFRTLLTLKVGVARSKQSYSFVDGWAGMIQGWIRDRVNGKALEEAVANHTKAVETAERNNTLSGMSPAEKNQFFAAEMSAQQDKRFASLTRAVETTRKASVAYGHTSDELLDLLVKRGIVPPRITNVPTDPSAYALQISADHLVQFCNGLTDRGDHGLIMQAASVLVGWLKSQEAATKGLPQIV